jgi:hypothetical protein
VSPLRRVVTFHHVIVVSQNTVQFMIGSISYDVVHDTILTAGSDEPTVEDHGVALQVAFERQTLKPAFSLDRL